MGLALGNVVGLGLYPCIHWGWLAVVRIFRLLVLLLWLTRFTASFSS